MRATGANRPTGSGRRISSLAGPLVGAAPVRTRDDGWVEITVPLADERELAPILIQLGPDAVVEDPPTLRDQVVARLEALLD